MTLAADRRRGPLPRQPSGDTDRPVEFWPTSAIRAALQTGDIATWQLIVVALKRDPYGRTARQVEEVLEGTESFGIAKALSEVLTRTRAHLEANERAEVGRHMRVLIERSGLSQQEFASRVGVPADTLGEYLSGTISPPASLMIRMRRLSDRFVKLHTREAPDVV
ncbi:MULTISPECIES: helix-turn-helix domain-containing protein [unclassified Mycobacterium]|uniref:helix-turn-helix domain-containing protein n=1 Tax=unclassified Mycobacterium TaxID=2642494 RepID=UPI0038773CB8